MCEWHIKQNPQSSVGFFGPLNTQTLKLTFEVEILTENRGVSQHDLPQNISQNRFFTRSDLSYGYKFEFFLYILPSFHPLIFFLCTIYRRQGVNNVLTFPNIEI